MVQFILYLKQSIAYSDFVSSRDAMAMARNGIFASDEPDKSTQNASESIIIKPKPGSELRKEIIDSLREKVIKDIGKKCVFKIDELNVKKDWAFMRGVPLEANGNKMDYRKTKYAEALREGIFDDWICALLKKYHGKWQVKIFCIGSTDVPWTEWPDKFLAPPEIFK